MSERILQALMQLFAIGSSLERQTSQSREIVESFLRQHVSLQRVSEYLSLYDDYVKQYDSGDDDTRARKKLSGSSVRMLRICTDINKELDTRQKYIVFLRLAEYMQSAESEITANEKEFLETVASVFTIDREEHLLFLALTRPELNFSECDLPSVLLVCSDHKSSFKNLHQFNHDADGELIFVYNHRAQALFLRYTGKDRLTLNGQPIDASRISVLAQGSVIRSQRMQPLYYSDLVRRFISSDSKEQFRFTAKNLDYVFPNGKKGLRDLSFSISSGKLAGIMGGSGAGKSTLLNILNGSSRPTSGKVLINGIDLYEGDGQLNGMIGNIPQDDLLIEELTVYQNLYYNTKLCFGEISDEEVRKKVIDVLDALGLREISDLKVGNVLNKTISGGQRKRLNIGLELVREPSILFVDEPTSGLSSRDAENVMDLLKQLSLNGKLIFVVIHQPSSEIFRMFDDLLMIDTGGYPVYFGNPSDAIVFFKRQVHLSDAEQSECPVCGNINPEQLFNILELHEVDEYGNRTSTRKITPAEWNSLFMQSSSASGDEINRGFSPPLFRKASAIRQWLIFFTRDLKSKLGNRQYLFINLLEAPVLALVLGFILRYSSGEEYHLIDNPNLPAYLFIGVIVALFLGLSVSAEEIIRDRKIQQREKFLHLSRTSYLMSKVSLLFIISAIQSASFVLIGNYVMGIEEMTCVYWLVLFSTACFANLLGLNVSAGLDSAVTVYILIPFLLIPQILLSGVIVRFEKLHPLITTQEGVPLIGNIMTSRWAFEALAVEQFANNPHEKKFFELDAALSRATYKKDWWIPAMTARLDKCRHLLNKQASNDSFAVPLTVLSSGFAEESALHTPGKFPFLEDLENKKFNAETARLVGLSLDSLREFYIDKFNATNERKEAIIARLTSNPEKQKNFDRQKNKFENESLEELVRNSNVRERLVVTDEKIIQRFEPVFHFNAREAFFAAPLFSSVKMFSGNAWQTLVANLTVIWVMTVTLYFTLHFNLFRLTINLFSRKRIR